jgi:hypothetical protein
MYGFTPQLSSSCSGQEHCTLDFSVITPHISTQGDDYHRSIYNKLRHSLVIAWTIHANHTIKPLGQIRDLVPTLPPPYPI